MSSRIRLRIRWKILLALLAFGIVPLILTAWLDARGLAELGSLLAQQSGQALSEQTHANLDQIADSYTQMVDRERQLIELIVRIQAREAETLLRNKPAARPFYWAESFDGSDESLKLTTIPDKYRHASTGGDLVPTPVSFDEQAFFVPASVTRSTVAADAERLAPLSTFYQEVHRLHANVIYRQYVALENGLIGSFPGHGAFPVDFDPRQRPWYIEQRGATGLRWSRPHIDAVGRRTFVNATAPIFDTAQNFVGVAGIDVALTSLLQSLILPSAANFTSEILLTFLFDDTDTTASEIAIAARTSDVSGGGDWHDLPVLERLKLADKTLLHTLRDEMSARQSGYLQVNYGGRDVYCVYRPFTDDSGYLLFMVPVAALADPAIKAAEYALASTQRQVDHLIPLAFAIVIMVIVVALLSSKSITKPINHLAAAAKRIGDGDFNVRVSVRTGDELQQLGEAFNAMIPQLEEHTRVREALELANEVQRHLLPNDSPQIEGIDIAGFSLYSEDTGGDYYDFLQFEAAPAKSIGIALGDVSGHGIASALLMATVRALLRSAADRALTPAQILQHINDKIVDDLHAGQFMTLFYFHVDLDSRRAQWSSAGHDPAIRFDRRTNTFSELAGNDIPLGVDSQWRYCETNEMNLSQDDLILLGTDGIWDTRNSRGELFGKPRLRDLIRQHQTESAETICNAIVTELRRFQGQARQRDDVTAVVFRLTI